MLLPAAPSHARAPCPGCMRQLQLESPVEKNQQQQLRLFKFNGRNARGDFTSEATPATTVQRFIVMLGNAETGPVARSCCLASPGLAWPGLLCTRSVACHHDWYVWWIDSSWLLCGVQFSSFKLTDRSALITIAMRRWRRRRRSSWRCMGTRQRMLLGIQSKVSALAQHL